MKITWYGTASVLLSSEGQSILFDPYLKYLPRGYETKERYERRLAAFGEQHHIFITHGHLDHLAHVSRLYRHTDCLIYVTRTPYRTLLRDGIAEDKLRLISPGDRITLGGITVRAVQGRHVKFLRSDIFRDGFTPRHLLHPLRKLRLMLQYLRYPEAGETLMYEILAEGKRVQLMGSAGLDRDTCYEPGADLLILPHQGRSDMDTYNHAVAASLAPKQILLDHYDDAFPPFSQNMDIAGFCSTVSETIPTAALVEGETVEI